MGVAVEGSSRVVEVASRLFAEGGYGATSVRAVADAAELSHTTVYRLYRNKEGLLAAATEKLTHDLDDILAMTPAPGTSVDRIAVIRSYLLALLRNRPAAQLLLFDASVRGTAVAQVLADQQRRLTARLVGPRASMDRHVRARCAMAIAQLGAGELRAVPLHRIRQPLLAAAIDSLVGAEPREVDVTPSGQVSLDLRSAATRRSKTIAERSQH